MATAGVKVLLIGRDVKDLPYEVEFLQDQKSVISAISRFGPDVILTFGNIPSALNVFAFETRKKWINLPENASASEVVSAVEICYRESIWAKHPNQEFNPLVSVYTPTFNTGDFLSDTYQSLKDQTYTNWEWVVVDDASTDGTWDRLLEIARLDPRVRPFQSGRPIRKIGAMKDMATRLCRGEYLVELDHDDMLVDVALSEIRDAFKKDPKIGMVYSNYAEFHENGSPHRYDGEFWKDRYRETEYRGKKYDECLTPDIYDRFGPGFDQQFAYFLTVGPNHVRAYRASMFRELGGYNSNLPVADDWDLFVRFFLWSKCHRIEKMLYLYRFLDAAANTTFVRNKSIQDHLALGREHYADAFRSVNKEQTRKPLVSVIIPTYKRLDLLRRAVASAKAQDYPAIEIIVVGDNCPDLAQAEIEGALTFNLVDNHRDYGASPRNYGISMASGEYIAYLDDDNEWTPDHVSSIMAAILNSGATWGFSSMLADGKDMGFDQPMCGRIDTSCIVHPKSFIGKYGGWKTDNEATYKNEWTLVEPWMKDEKWVCTKKATLIYNVETSGQKDYLETLVKV